MLLTKLLKPAGALLLVAMLLAQSPVHAAAPKPAQLGPVWLGGGLTSGSTLSYQLNLTVTSPGTLTAKASITGKNWKANFPVLTATPPVGVSLLDSATGGATVTVPAGFTGPAKLRIKVYVNGRPVGAVNILLTITAPPAVPPVPQTTWYDVGFSSNVVVNAGAVNTSGLVPPLTYAWTITDTDVRTNATFSDATAATPIFNTQSVTTFGIDIDKKYDLDVNPNLVGIDTEQVNKSTYHLRVIVKDSASGTRTGAVTVVCSSVSPAQQTIPVGERQYLTAFPNGTNASTFAWTFVTRPDGTLARPTGSTAVIENAKTRTASLRPDKVGDYTLQVAVTGGGATSNTFVVVSAAKFVGASTCASCHGPGSPVGLDDYYTPWTQTKHATFFQRSIDGLTSSYYNESCVGCHTVGYNKAPLADNNGFDDVQKTTGWQFPSPLQGGNYFTLPANLKDKANIQCESCHGPGSIHPGENSTSLDVAVCATCHQDGNHHNRPYQWKLGPHGADDKYLEVSIEEAPNASCAKCHSPAGLVDAVKGDTPIRTLVGRLTCQGCHDPHNVAGFPPEAHQVRVYDTVTLDDSVAAPITLTGQGASAMCMYCHHARRSPPSTAISTGSNATRTPHESTATDVLLGLRACTNVQYVAAPGVTNTLASVTLVNSAHTGVAKCINCHMHNAGKNTVGDHTFSMTDRLTDEDNLGACNQCHAGVDPVTDFDHISVVISGRPHGGDYDGNGETEGVQTEVDGLLDNLINKMLATGMTRGSGGASWAGYSTNTLTRAVQRNAAWNEWLIERELSHGVHNTAFTVRLLQWSYTVLSTNTGGNAYSVDFPNADLR